MRVVAARLGHDRPSNETVGLELGEGGVVDVPEPEASRRDRALVL